MGIVIGGKRPTHISPWSTTPTLIMQGIMFFYPIFNQFGSSPMRKCAPGASFQLVLSILVFNLSILVFNLWIKIKYQQGCIGCPGGITEKTQAKCERRAASAKLPWWKTGFATQQRTLLLTNASKTRDNARFRVTWSWSAMWSIGIFEAKLGWSRMTLHQQLVEGVERMPFLFQNLKAVVSFKIQRLHKQNSKTTQAWIV